MPVAAVMVEAEANRQTVVQIKHAVYRSLFERVRRSAGHCTMIRTSFTVNDGFDSRSSCDAGPARSGRF